VEDGKVRARLLRDYSIEIGGGLGALKGQIWRIGLMGHNSTPQTVFTFLGALESVLLAEGLAVPPGAAIAAAREVYSQPAASARARCAHPRCSSFGWIG